jgi:hypothetical protein
MSIVACDKCGIGMPEEDIDAHMIAEHPYWARLLHAELVACARQLQRIAEVLEKWEAR